MKLQEERNKLLQANRNLLKKLKQQNVELKRLKKEQKNETKKKIYKVLEKCFTPKQIHWLLNPNKTKVRWNVEDIASAITLKSVSSAAYRYLLKKNYPLPSPRTLRRWASQLELKNGVLLEVLQFMKATGMNLTDYQKLVVLCLDEVYISQMVEIDLKAEQVVGPHKSVQTGVVRGLFHSYKQVIYYDYDTSLTPVIVKDIINQLYIVGFTVVALTTDQGGANVATIKSMVGENEFYFIHPSCPDLKVFVFGDAPHALKLARNWYLDKGFIYEGKEIKRNVMDKVLKANNSDLKVAFKLRPSDLTVSGASRQKVSPAARLFCNTNAKAVGYLGHIGVLGVEDNWKETEEIFSLINDWFDVFNSTTKQFHSRDPLKNPYGKGNFLEKQDKILDKMIAVMQNLRVIGKTELMPWQKAVIFSCRSLKAFLPYLKEKYTSQTFNVQYIITNRLNQDVIENLFAALRAMGATYDKPGPLNYRYRLRKYIIGRNAQAVLSNYTNTKDASEEENLVNLDSAFQVEPEEVVSPEEMENLEAEFLEDFEPDNAMDFEASTNLFNKNSSNCFVAGSVTFRSNEGNSSGANETEPHSSFSPNQISVNTEEFLDLESGDESEILARHLQLLEADMEVDDVLDYAESELSGL